jgi:nucleotide-binding universal stress UspA family protein
MAVQAQKGAFHPVEEYEKHAGLLAEKILAAVSAIAKEMSVACNTMHVKDQRPADGIVETAKAKGCDLIVMASHGRGGLQKALLGSQAVKVLAYSSISVLICKCERGALLPMGLRQSPPAQPIDGRRSAVWRATGYGFE